MAYEKQIWNQYDDLKTEEENIENGAVVTDNRMNHIEEGIEAHTADLKNPHSVTAEQVGLGNVPDYAAATEEEALAGESNETVMTPSLTKTAAKSYVTKEDVGLSKVTNDEQATKTDFNAHTANKSNPHSVTASQVGAYSKSEADSKLALKANESEVIHNSGDETIAGKKSFSDDASFKNLKVSDIIEYPVLTGSFDSSNVPGVKLEKDGNTVAMRLVATVGSAIAAGGNIGRIPTGFIPSVQWHFRAGTSTTSEPRVTIDPTGLMVAVDAIAAGTSFRDTLTYIL